MNNKKHIVLPHKEQSKIKFLPHNNNSLQKKDKTLFGLWADRDFSVDKYIRDIREKFKQ
jgi:DNA-binding response OmpR family regulator